MKVFIRLVTLFFVFSPSLSYAVNCTGVCSFSNSNLGLFPITECGADGSDTSSDDVALYCALESADAAGGGTVHFPKGKYYIDFWSTTFKTTSPIKLVGDGKELSTLTGINNPNHKRMFQIESSFEISDLMIEDWQNLIVKVKGGLLGTIESLTIADSSFKNVAGNVNLYSIFDTEAEVVSIKDIRIERNKVWSEGGSNAGGIIRLNSGVTAENIYVRDNILRDLSYSAISIIGKEIAGVLTTDTIEDVWVSGNTIEGIDSNSRNDVHGIIVMGKNVLITDNVVKDVGCSGGCADIEGIYTKALRGRVSGNVVENAGGSVAQGSDAAIAIKGVNRNKIGRAGWGMIVANNHVRRDAPSITDVYKGIRVTTQDAMIIGNWLENFTLGISIGPDSSTGNVSVQSNQIHGSTFAAGKGAAIEVLGTADGRQITGNTVVGSNGGAGILVKNTQTSMGGKILISGNSLSGDNSFTGIDVIASGTIEDLHISNNLIDGADEGINFTGTEATDVVITNNHFNDVVDQINGESNVTPTPVITNSTGDGI